MIFAYPRKLHGWLHILWDILPYALDRVLAGEMDWREIHEYTWFTLQVEAGVIDVLVGDAVAAYQVVPDYDAWNAEQDRIAYERVDAVCDEAGHMRSQEL